MDTEQSDNTIRINKYVAFAGGHSRRKADELIASNRITINDEPVLMGARVSPTDAVKMDGKILTPPSNSTTIAFHKPRGFVCSRRQQGDIPTIYSLLPDHFSSLKPVGRLDANSSGIILLTNDGDFAHRMTHPSFHKQKIYEVTIDHDLEPLHQQMISDYGVELADGNSKLHLTRASEDNRVEWIVDMHEGRNRQIRRTFDSLGYHVRKLHRTSFGPFHLGDLKRGSYTEIKNNTH